MVSLHIQNNIGFVGYIKTRKNISNIKTHSKFCLVKKQKSLYKLIYQTNIAWTACPCILSCFSLPTWSIFWDCLSLWNRCLWVSFDVSLISWVGALLDWGDMVLPTRRVGFMVSSLHWVWLTDVHRDSGFSLWSR